jgi:hypothetical protein
MNKSINQLAQENGETSANEAQRIREREVAVMRAGRTVAFFEGEAACTAARIASESGMPIGHVRFVCGNHGMDLR